MLAVAVCDSHIGPRASRRVSDAPVTFVTLPATHAPVRECPDPDRYAEPMADFLRHLPLSGRPREDEGVVSSDRRRELDALIENVTSLIGDRPLWTDFATQAGLSREWQVSGGDVAAFRAALRARRRGIRVVARALAAALRTAKGLGQDLSVDPMTSGAVALYAQAAGPFERRAVVAGRTVRATDADWAFGTGPVVEGTSLQIAGFLLGITDDPPMPPRNARSDKPAAGRE